MNKTILTHALAFVGGGGIGAVITWLVSRKKFEDEIEEIVQERFDEEIEPIRKAVDLEVKAWKEKQNGKSNKNSKTDSDETHDVREKAERAREKGDLFEHARAINEKSERTNYAQIARKYQTEDEVKENPDYIEVESYEPDIEIISPAEFDTDPNYTTKTFYYLRDGVVVDETGEVIDDVEHLIGYDSLDQFGEYGESDSVYIRNNTENLEIAVYKSDETVSSFNH